MIMPRLSRYFDPPCPLVYLRGEEEEGHIPLAVNEALSLFGATVPLITSAPIPARPTPHLWWSCTDAARDPEGPLRPQQSLAASVRGPACQKAVRHLWFVLGSRSGACPFAVRVILDDVCERRGHPAPCVRVPGINLDTEMFYCYARNKKGDLTFDKGMATFPTKQTGAQGPYTFREVKYPSPR